MSGAYDRNRGETISSRLIHQSPLMTLGGQDEEREEERMQTWKVARQHEVWEQIKQLDFSLHILTAHMNPVKGFTFL